MIEIIIAAITTLASVVLAVFGFISKIKNTRFIQKVQQIASAVEQVGRGLSGSDKLSLFKTICLDHKVNVSKATAYLEQYIIPITNGINVFKKQQQIQESVKEVE